VAQTHRQIRIVSVPGNGFVTIIQHDKIIAETMHFPKIYMHYLSSFLALALNPAQIQAWSKTKYQFICDKL
jgi:hypothetical protein